MTVHDEYDDDNFIGNDLESTDYDDTEYVFSRDNENSMIVPKLSCDLCGYSLTGSDDELLKQDARNYDKKSTRCSCGHLYTNKKVSQPDKSEEIEHMQNVDVSSPSVILISFIPYLIFLIFCYLLAASRKELTVSSGFCIFFFPYMYISYVLIDYFVLPSH
jgi:hypothetical protein